MLFSYVRCPLPDWCHSYPDLAPRANGICVTDLAKRACWKWNRRLNLRIARRHGSSECRTEVTGGGGAETHVPLDPPDTCTRLVQMKVNIGTCPLCVTCNQPDFCVSRPWGLSGSFPVMHNASVMQCAMPKKGVRTCPAAHSAFHPQASNA